MRRFDVALVLFTVVGLSGCAGGSGPTPQGNGGFAVLPPAAPEIHSLQYAGLRALYVLDYSTGYVDVLKNKGYREIGSVADGGSPNDITLDNQGNLYIANLTGKIDEYKPSGTSPFFTYSAGMHQADSVTVDAHGNVFEGDGNGSAGTINEYYQGVNTVLYACPLGGFADDIALDASNDVFVASGAGSLVEYQGGLRGCNATKLTPTGLSSSFNGIATDKNGNLLVGDLANGAVDVIAPPYSSVTRTIGSGFFSPWTVTLNKDNKLAFVTDISKNDADVTIVDYSTGTNVKTLAGGNGLVSPIAAVDGPNSVR